MSLSDCEKCWNTPCSCGWNYKDWDEKRLTKFLCDVTTYVDKDVALRSLKEAYSIRQLKFTLNKKPKPKFLAVIHLRNPTGEYVSREIIDNVKSAVNGGADGVFLINQDRTSDFEQILRVGEAVKSWFPSLWLGANVLRESFSNILQRLTKDFDGLWTDHAGIDDESDLEAIQNRHASKWRSWRGQYFGGVAFKYQKVIKNLAKVTARSRHYVDVITTSGPETGIPADIDKIKIMKEAAGSTPLALASGVTAENIYQYIPYVDYFLIGTFLEESPYKVSKDRVAAIRSEIDKHGNI